MTPSNNFFFNNITNAQYYARARWIMESRRIAFAFGAVVGLSAALLSGRYARWRQSNGGEQLQRVDQQDVNAEANVGDTVAQLEGSPPQLLSSSTKYFK